MGEDDIVTQMGLMLTQIRHARRALEDIERSTARYAGFAFASALQAGPSFGAPPLLDGALKVYVVNINDLAPGTGFGGFLESLLGGIGRFFGGLGGGFVGGILSGVSLPYIIGAMVVLTGRIENILKKLGFSFGTKDKDKDKGKETGPTLKSQLDDIKRIVDAFTALFTAATDPDKAGRLVEPKTDAGVQWLNIFKTADSLVRGISRVVDGLIILIPILVGALALVVVHLRDIQREVLGLLRFLLREVLVLRGVLLFTLYDTIAGAAKLGSFVLSTLNATLQTILASVGNIFPKLLDVGLNIIKFLANSLMNTAHLLLKWVADTVEVVLKGLGDSKIIRAVIHIVQVLPLVLPSLLKVVFKEAEPAELANLKKASDLVLQVKPDFPPGGKTLGELIPPVPTAEQIIPQKEQEALGEKLKTSIGEVGEELKKALSASVTALDDIGKRLEQVKDTGPFFKELEVRETAMRKTATTLSEELTKVKSLLESAPNTGLEKIATAYQDWLNGDGLKSVVAKIDEHFTSLGPFARIGQLVDWIAGHGDLREMTGAFGPTPEAAPRPRATVEIKELLIELDPDAAVRLKQPEQDVYFTSLTTEGDPHDLFHSRDDELKQRGFVPAPGALFNLA